MNNYKDYKEEGTLEKLYAEVLGSALEELSQAVRAMIVNTVPATALPEPKKHQITATILWPDTEAGYPCFSRMRCDDGSIEIPYSVYEPKWLIQRIIKDCGRQPAAVLKAVESIEAASAWCEARRIGRLKAAENILRQQEAALESLKKRAAAE